VRLPHQARHPVQEHRLGRQLVLLAPPEGRVRETSGRIVAEKACPIPTKEIGFAEAVSIAEKVSENLRFLSRSAINQHRLFRSARRYNAAGCLRQAGRTERPPGSGSPHRQREALQDPLPSIARQVGRAADQGRPRGHMFWKNRGGRLHRSRDKPAAIWVNGPREWRLNGQRHREGDQPAVINADGTREWWVSGKRIR